MYFLYVELTTIGIEISCQLQHFSPGMGNVEYLNCQLTSKSDFSFYDSFMIKLITLLCIPHLLCKY